jgi:sulfate adenylyltransferase subunit 1 (EFTu-like GTPase family)
MDSEPLKPGGRYTIKHTSHTATAIVERLINRVDVDTLEREPSPPELVLNDIARVSLRTSAAMAIDPYSRNRRTGSFVLIDESTDATVAAGMIVAEPL